MDIFVLNIGSSSIKASVWQGGKKNTEILIKNIGEPKIEFKILTSKTKIAVPSTKIKNHEEGLAELFDVLKTAGIDLVQFDRFAHRVVHGGAEFYKPMRITQKVKNIIKKYEVYAPLHNPFNLLGILECEKKYPKVANYAVFDTAPFHNMPAKAYLYGIPYKYYARLGIRKYGFHGTSHLYVATRTAKMLKKPLRSLRIITCHLGNGSSVAGFKNGRAVDISIGLSTTSGLVMGTRTGDMDPMVIPALMRRESLHLADVENIVQHKSGLLGLSGISSNMEDVYRASRRGNSRARLTIDVWAYRLISYVSSFYGVLGGLDAVVFTGGIGENFANGRQIVCEQLRHLGMKLNRSANSKKSDEERVISLPGSKIKILVIPTHEDKMMAELVSKV